jgi:hypothetical protein
MVLTIKISRYERINIKKGEWVEEGKKARGLLTEENKQYTLMAGHNLFPKSGTIVKCKFFVGGTGRAVNNRISRGLKLLMCIFYPRKVKRDTVEGGMPKESPMDCCSVCD